MPRLLTPSRVADFRNRLCDVAMQLLAEVGYEGFNMRELASRLGVSAMTAYRYFKDKDEILATIRARALDGMADRLEAGVGAAGGPEAKCASVCRAYVEFARQEPIYYRLMFETPRRLTEATSQDFERAESRVRAALTAYLRTGERRSAADPELFGRVLWSTLHGIVTLYLGNKLSDAEMEQAVAEGLRLIAAGHGELAGAHLHLPQAGKWAETGARHQSGAQRDGMVALSAAS